MEENSTRDITNDQACMLKEDSLTHSLRRDNENADLRRKSVGEISVWFFPCPKHRPVLLLNDFAKGNSAVGGSIGGPSLAE